jgi:hypothetical protein
MHICLPRSVGGAKFPSSERACKAFITYVLMQTGQAAYLNLLQVQTLHGSRSAFTSSSMHQLTSIRRIILSSVL